MQSGVESSPQRAALIFVFITLALDSIALGVVGPVFVPLIEGFLHGDVQRAATIVGIFGTVYALMQFVWAPFLGVLSDRIGRRPVIVISNLGMAVDYAVRALAPNLLWLLAGRVVSGVTTANMTVASAAASAENRCACPSASRASAGAGRRRSSASAGAMCSSEVPGTLRQAGERAQARSNFLRMAGA